ncbi:MAG: amino acid permease [Chitinophagaceae bacterium]
MEFPGLTLTIISAVIGAGIFVLPAIVGDALGAFSIFAYIVCGILFATILLCYAEIGSNVTTSGGSYAYVEAAFGNLPAT